MKTKDAGLRIRIDRDLRESFVAACRDQDKAAAQVLREFMRDYVTTHPVRRLRLSGEMQRKHRK